MDNNIRLITDFRVLMRHAKELALANKSGDLERINKAKKIHDGYRDLCLKSDSMMTGLNASDI